MGWMEKSERRVVYTIRASTSKIQVQMQVPAINKDISKEEVVKSDKMKYQRWGEGRNKDDWNLGIGKDCIWQGEEEEPDNETPFSLRFWQGNPVEGG